MTRDELRAKARAAWRRLRGGELTPTRAALSVAVGLAVGVTPLWGGHIFLVLAVCVPLGLDAPVSYLAANISIPPVAPLLGLVEVELGAWLLTRRALPLDAATLRGLGPWSFAKELLWGTALFAPAVAIVGGALTYVLVAATRGATASAASRAAPLLDASFDAAVTRVAERFAGGRRSAFHYARGKMRGDPVVRRVFELASADPFGEVADVGAGRGQTGILLLEGGLARKVTGFDWDAPKVKDAARAAAGLDASFEVGDLRARPIDACDTALLLDVLHYLTDAEQDELLARAARAARRRVLVRELDPDRGWRSAVTRVEEGVMTRVRYNRGARVRVRPIARIASALEAEGFVVTVEPCWGKTPFSNVLVVATRGSAVVA